MQTPQARPQVHHFISEINLPDCSPDDADEESALLPLQALFQQTKYPSILSGNLLVANFLSALYLVIEPNSRRVEIALYQVRNTTEVSWSGLR